ncbi:ABC-three component system middle component 1 [Priestia megaterium]|uniref:ABC-three component system middle component 1 n=1 Tax=Priestia megaterium TaxID=1404 RepID=UPI001C2385E8|nr:ABC-three component system middle component 1 [Priestia megaterium]MBU8852751.1 hypothetical protein [Bacillus sp. FJAT-26377]MCU7738867.1 hypothetical protein [Priestia megaterium]
MNSYEATYIRLKEKEFVQEKESIINNLGLATFRKDHIYIIIQNLDLGMKVEDIKEESIRIREKLHESKINVWNTYYVLCADEEVIDVEYLFFVEREPSGLRKYVINEVEDLNRIPFLDNQPVNKFSNPIQMEDNIPENNTTIKSLFDFIKENNGTEMIIPENRIDEAIDRLLWEELSN